MDVSTHQHLTRQLDLIPIETLGLKVNIIGCGAIGSFAALALAKMGLTRIEVWDHDTVSIENMSNQFFRFDDIDKNKAIALAELVHSFTRVDLKVNAHLFDEDQASRLQGVVIVAVDSMEARVMIYNAIKENAFGVKYIIDPRMGSETYLQYTMNPFDEKDQTTYEKTLYSDGDAVQERCTAKSTVYTATLAAGMVTKTVKNILLKQDYPRSTQWDIQASKNPMVMHPGNERAPLAGHPKVPPPQQVQYTGSPHVVV